MIERVFLRQIMSEPTGAFVVLDDVHLGLYAPYGVALRNLFEKLDTTMLSTLTPALLWAEVPEGNKTKLTELDLGISLLEALNAEGVPTPEEVRYSHLKLREEKARNILSVMLDEMRSRVVLDDPKAVLAGMFKQAEVAQRVLSGGEKEYLRGQEIADYAVGMLAEFYTTGSGWKCGMPEIDDLLGGFRPGQLIVVGAWTGHGKSLFTQALSDGITICNAAAGEAFFLDCEMGLPATVGRITQRIAGYRITSPQTLEQAVERLQPHLSRVAGSKTVVGAPTSLTLPSAIQRSQAAVALGCRVIVWDGGNLLRVPGKENRQQELEEITRTAKRFALEHDVVMMITGQLLQTPAPQNGSLTRPPEIEDFKGSRSFSEDADYAFLVRRMDYKPASGDVELLGVSAPEQVKAMTGATCITVGKDRHSGQRGTNIILNLDGRSLRYREEALMSDI